MAAALYGNIVTVIEAYLGPAGQRFVDRQINFHLNKQPQEVAPDDLPHLVEWIKVSLSLLTDDRKMVEECAQKLTRLS